MGVDVETIKPGDGTPRDNVLDLIIYVISINVGKHHDACIQIAGTHKPKGSIGPLVV